MMKQIDKKTFIVAAFAMGTIIFGLFVAYDVWTTYKSKQVTEEPADTTYFGKLREYEKNKLAMQGRIDSLTQRIDSLQEANKKNKTNHANKANRVIHWNNDSTTKYWADYFNR